MWEGMAPEAWLDFSANLRPEGPPAWVTEALDASIDAARYYPDPDMKRARKGLALYAGVPEEWILPTAGGEAAIDVSLTEESGTVYTLEPSFCEYERRAALHGRKHEAWQGQFATGDTLIFSRPQNPTFRVMDRTSLLALRSRLQKQGAGMIVDEAFIDFCPDETLRKDAGPGLMVLGSLTKVLGIPGVRLGYVCAHPDVIRRLERRVLPWALSAQATEIAARLPEHMSDMRRDAEVNRKRREEFAACLRRYGAEVMPSMANFLLADFHTDMADAVRQLRSRGILVRVCDSFGLPGSCLRLAVKTDEENMRLIEELEAIRKCAVRV